MGHELAHEAGERSVAAAERKHRREVVVAGDERRVRGSPDFADALTHFLSLLCELFRLEFGPHDGNRCIAPG
ncbi:MAG: hypothetical protein KKC79_16255, partial [Gammaproteobacteria bacterium]|nr:hypothetical protein [Gammaproteobacteria bacterium]